HVGIVELNFGARLVAGRNPVPREDGSIERSRRPAARVATLRGDVAMNQTDARDAGDYFCRRAGTLVPEALVVGTLHWDARRRFRILIRRLVVGVLRADGAGNRDHQSKS